MCGKLSLQWYSQTVRVKLPSTANRSSCYRHQQTTEVAVTASSVAGEMVGGCWRHRQDSASTWVYWTSVQLRLMYVLSTAARLRRHGGQVVWDSWVSSRTSLQQPTETASTSVVTLTDNNQLSTSHSQTNLPSYFNTLLLTTSSSPSEVRQIIGLVGCLIAQSNTV